MAIAISSVPSVTAGGEMLSLSFAPGHRSGTVGLTGEIDAFNAATLPARVAELVVMPSSHTLHVALDRVEFCDLAGLDAIAGLRQLGYPTVLLGHPPHLQRLFELTGRDDLLE